MNLKSMPGQIEANERGRRRIGVTSSRMPALSIEALALSFYNGG